MDKRILIVLLGALSVACGNDEAAQTGIGNDGAAPQELLLSSGISVERADTRSASVQDTKFDSSTATERRVDVFISENGGSTTTYAQPVVAQTFSASDGKMSFINASSGAALPQYWPSSGNGVYITAWYPSGATHTNGTAKAFAIQTNQTSAANYRASDLTASAKTAYVRSGRDGDGYTALTFKHLLTRLHLKLKAGGKGITDAKLAGATVQLGNNDIFTSVTPNLDAGTMTVKNGNSDPKGSVTCTMNTGTGNLEGYIIIPPQDLRGKTVKVTLSSTYGSGQYSATLGSVDANNLTSGGQKAFLYEITVTGEELKVSSSITTWGADGTTGNASATFAN